MKSWSSSELPEGYLSTARGFADLAQMLANHIDRYDIEDSTHARELYSYRNQISCLLETFAKQTDELRKSATPSGRIDSTFYYHHQ